MPLILLLKGTLPAPISSTPLVILIYVVLLLMLGGALGSVLLRNSLYAIGAFAGTLLLASIFYLTVAPFFLFAVQLLIVSTLSAALLAAFLARTTGLQASAVGPFSRESIVGAAAAAALLALVGVIAAATSWPVRACCSAQEDFVGTVLSAYPVALATAALLLVSAAIGGGLILAGASMPTRRTPAVRPSTPRGRGRR